MKHGLLLNAGRTLGPCCYNRRSTVNNQTYDIDPVNCKTCVDSELAGIKSYRQGANEKYGLDHTHNSIITLDITPNRNCNLTCKICNEHSSSSWMKLKGKQINKFYNLSVEDLSEMLKSYDLSQLSEINFSGGEPFLNNNIVKYISPLIQNVDVKKCQLRFSTNGTIKASNRILDFFKKFSLVNVRVSFDDIESGFEYQRYPANWSKCEENWNYLLHNSPPNVMFSLNRTVSILNINRLEIMDNWHKKYYDRSPTGDPIEIIDHFAFGPYNLSNISTSVKDYITNTHDVQSKAWQYIQSVSPLNNLSLVKSTIQHHDTVHGTDFSSVDPELYKIIFQ